MENNLIRLFINSLIKPTLSMLFENSHQHEHIILPSKNTQQLSAVTTIQFSLYRQLCRIDQNKYELISYWHKNKCKALRSLPMQLCKSVHLQLFRQSLRKLVFSNISIYIFHPESPQIFTYFFQSIATTVPHQLHQLSNTEYVESQAARLNTQRDSLHLSMTQIFTSTIWQLGSLV